MNMLRLTGKPPAATIAPMENTGQAAEQSSRHAYRHFVRVAAMLVGSALTLSGCISVNAPDEPIVIELNINIKQEVVYRLDAGVQDLIKDNEDIF